MLYSEEGVQRLLQAFHMVPKRGLSQNFLFDETAIDMAVRAACVSDLQVFEIGPGLGALTYKLAEHAAKVLAVDLDPRCVGATRAMTAGFANVEILQGDALTVDPLEHGLVEGYSVVANLPYHLTGLFLRSISERRLNPLSAVLLVQKEVALRLVGESQGWSLMTVATHLACDAQLVGIVPASHFYPAPTVSSAFIRLEPHARYETRDAEDILVLARSAFQGRRKTIANALAGNLGSKERAVSVLGAAGVPAGIRAEELRIPDWLALARCVRDHSS